MSSNAPRKRRRPNQRQLTPGPERQDYDGDFIQGKNSGCLSAPASHSEEDDENDDYVSDRLATGQQRVKENATSMLTKGNKVEKKEERTTLPKNQMERQNCETDFMLGRDKPNDQQIKKQLQKSDEEREATIDEQEGS